MVAIDPDLVVTHNSLRQSSHEKRDVAIYALRVGACGRQAVDDEELKFVYHRDGQPFIQEQQVACYLAMVVGGLLFAIFFAVFARGGATHRPKVPALYVFGDSLVDVGNNNYMTGTDAKANYAPYGIDFPHKHPTGRFSNGYNGADFLAIHMGFRRSPPPYLSLASKTNHQVSRGLRGVNFASGGSGILNSTGLKGSSITVADQVQYFAKFRSDVATRIGSKLAKHRLSKSIFLISAGGNDIFAFIRQQTSLNTTEAEQFIEGILLPNLRDHIKSLYSLGARKFLLINMGPLGCCPFVRASNPSEGCNNGMNDLALVFNGALKTLMSNISSTLEGMKYSIGDAYALTSLIIANPDYHGHIEVKKACCGSGKLNAQVRCNQNTTYCAKRGQYMYWDLIHPSQATSKTAMFAFYRGSLKFASPINAKKLVEAP